MICIDRFSYQYIPTVSNHKSSLFKNFVLQELKRYSLACTDNADLDSIIKAFKERLQARGYEDSILQDAITSLPPRNDLLQKLRERILLPVPTRYKPVPPIVTLCVPRLDPPIPWRRLFSIPPSIASHYAFINN